MRYTKYLLIGVMDEKEATTHTELGRTLKTPNSYISTLINQLERDGYIIREHNLQKGKRKMKKIFLTKKGTEVKKYFLKRKEELGLAWSEVLHYKGPF